MTDITTEELLKEAINQDTLMMTQKFTQKEQLQVSYIPFIITQIAIQYADMVLKMGADYKIGILKKLSMAVKKVKKDYDYELSKDLDYRHREMIVADACKIIEDNQLDFTRLYFSVNNEFKRVFPDYPYDDMRSNAIVSMLFIRLLDKHNKRMDKLIHVKLGKRQSSIILPSVTNLYRCMDAYVGDMTGIKLNEKNIEVGMNVIYNKIINTKYSIL